MSSDSAGQPVAIIGAGITGLSAAFRIITLREDIEVDIYEASSRTGGAIRTESRDGFLIEHGPDSFITNKPGGVQLCDDLDFSEQLIGTQEQYRRSLVVHRGQPVPIPDGFMLMAPAKPMAILTTPILSMTGKLRLLSEWFRPAKAADGDESLASFVRRRFGTETLDRLVQPLVGGIYTSDPEQLSLQATMPRFLTMEREHGGVIRATLKAARAGSGEEVSGSGARYGMFAAPANGLSSLIDCLTERLLQSERVRIHFETKVTGVRQSDGAWTLSIDGAPSAVHNQLLLTTPAWISAGLLADCGDSELVRELQTIEYASSAIIVSGHRLSDFSDPLNAFGLVVPAVENREVLAVSFSSRKFPGRAPDGQILLRTFVGGAMQPELFDRPDGELVNIAERELQDLLGMCKAPSFMNVCRHTRAMPQYHVGHLDRVRRIEQRTQEHAGLELAGNAYVGVGIPDSISSGYAAAERVVNSATG